MWFNYCARESIRSLHSICKAETNACIIPRIAANTQSLSYVSNVYFHFHGLTSDHIILKSSNGTKQPVGDRLPFKRDNQERILGPITFVDLTFIKRPCALLEMRAMIIPLYKTNRPFNRIQYRFDSREKSHEAAKLR